MAFIQNGKTMCLGCKISEKTNPDRNTQVTNSVKCSITFLSQCEMKFYTHLTLFIAKSADAVKLSGNASKYIVIYSFLKFLKRKKLL
jgi:hypothetical protein